MPHMNFNGFISLERSDDLVELSVGTSSLQAEVWTAELQEVWPLQLDAGTWITISRSHSTEHSSA